MSYTAISFLICEEAENNETGSHIFVLEGKKYNASMILPNLDKYKNKTLNSNLKIAKISHAESQDCTNKNFYKFLGWVNTNGVLIK